MKTLQNSLVVPAPALKPGSKVSIDTVGLLITRMTMRRISKMTNFTNKINISPKKISMSRCKIPISLKKAQSKVHTAITVEKGGILSMSQTRRKRSLS